MMSSTSAEHYRTAETGSNARVILERFLPYRLSVLASLTSQALAQIYAERFGLISDVVPAKFQRLIWSSTPIIELETR